MLLASAAGVGEITSIGSLVFVVLAAIGAYISYRLRQRGQSGDAQKTSDAGVLWAQSQAMITQLGSEKMKAEEQRDRLIELQASQILPAMTAMNMSLHQISEALVRMDTIITRLGAQYGERRKVPLQELREQRKDGKNA